MNSHCGTGLERCGWEVPQERNPCQQPRVEEAQLLEDTRDVKLLGPGGLRGGSERSIVGTLPLPTLSSGPHRDKLASSAVGIGTPGGLCTPRV